MAFPYPVAEINGGARKRHKKCRMPPIEVFAIMMMIGIALAAGIYIAYQRVIYEKETANKTDKDNVHARRAAANADATINVARQVLDDDFDDGSVGCTYVPEYDTKRPLPTTTIPQNFEVQPRGFKTIVTRAGGSPSGDQPSATGTDNHPVAKDAKDNVHTLAPRFTLPTKVRSDYPTFLTSTWWLLAGGIMDEHLAVPKTWDVGLESTAVPTSTTVAGAGGAVTEVAARELEDIALDDDFSGIAEFLDMFDRSEALEGLGASDHSLDEELSDDLQAFVELDASDESLEARSSGPKWQAFCKAVRGAMKDKEKWQDADHVAQLRKVARECTKAGYHVAIPAGLPKVTFITLTPTPTPESTPEPTEASSITGNEAHKSREEVCRDAERTVKRLYDYLSRASWLKPPARSYRAVLETVRKCRERGILSEDSLPAPIPDTIPLPPGSPPNEGQLGVEAPPSDDTATRRIPKVPPATDDSTRQIMTEGHPATPTSTFSSATRTHRIPKQPSAAEVTRQIMTEGRPHMEGHTLTPASTFTPPTSTTPLAEAGSAVGEPPAIKATYRFPKLPIGTAEAGH